MVALRVVVAYSTTETEFVWRSRISIRQADMADKMHEPLDMQVLPEQKTKKIPAHIKK